MSRSFSGTNQYLSIASPLSLARPFFVGLWSKKSSTGQTANLISVGVSGASTNYNRVGWDSSDRVVSTTHDGTASSSGLSGNAADTNYHFVGANHGSATSRTSVLDDTFGTEQTTSRIPAVAADSIFIGVLGNLSQDYAGLGAHMFAVRREITAGERTALNGGANPRALFTTSELAFYLPATANDGSEFTDAVHSNVFTNTGTTFSADDPTIDALPVFSGTISAQSNVEDSAITPVDLSGFWTGPGTYSVTSGALPDGLTLDPNTGIVSGTPPTPATATGIVVSKTSGVYPSPSNSFSWEITAAAVAPVKTAATVDDASATAYTLGAEYTQNCTEYAVAMPVGTADPNAAAIVAGTGATGTASNAQTANTPDTYTLTPSHTPKHPLYDIHRIARNAGGDSAITRHYDEPLDPPSGKQFVTVSGLPWGPSITAITAANPPEFTVDADIQALFWETGDPVWLWDLTGDWSALNAAFDAPTQDFTSRTITVTGTNTFTVAIDASAFGAFTSGGFAAVDRSLLEGATPAVVDGDVMVAPLVTTPDGFTFTLNADGTWGYDSGGSAAPQTIEFDVFDYSAQDYYGAVDVYFADSGPVLNPEITDEDRHVRRALGTTALVIDLLEHLSDPDGDPLTFTLAPSSVNSLEDVGGSFDVTDSELLTLDPAVAIWGALLTVRGTTPSGQYREFTFEIDYGPLIPTSIANTSEASATAVLEALPVTVAIGTSVYSSSIAEGNVVSTSPAAGTIVESGSVVTVYLSQGAFLGGGAPNIRLSFGFGF